MPHLARPGRSLETLTAALERALGKRSNVTVESPGFRTDRVTGERREHDVLVTASSGHHVSLIAIECRDRSRKVTVNEVEGFYTKCEDTGINQGVIVSSKGFTKTALVKAKHLGIRTLGLTEVESFSWLATAGVTGHTRKVKHISWLFEPAEKLDPLPTRYTVLMADGKPVQSELLMAAATAEFHKLPYESTPPPNGAKTIIFPTPGLALKDDDTGTSYPIERAVVDVMYEVDVEFMPFQLVTYAETSSANSITDAAVASIKLGAMEGKLMIVYKEEQGGNVYFVPDRPKGV
jgi:Restriction endonuclease